MSEALRIEGRRITADEFLKTDQSAFGDAWRYELVDGLPVAQAAPSPDHGAIVVNLGAELKQALKGRRPCRVEGGSAAVPRRKTRDRARIPDVMVRCDGRPAVVFEVISPTEERSQRLRDERRRDLMDVEGVAEIVEITQDEFVAHVYRRAGDLWAFEALTGPEAVLRLESLDIAIPLAALYDQVLEAEPAAGAGT